MVGAKIMETPRYDYAKFVAQITKPGRDIAASLTPEEAHLIHMIMGIAGEAGELLDSIKKHVIYQKPLDLANVREELGDIEFYLQGLRNGLQLDRQSIIDENYGKLSKRYSAGTYSNEQAITRADKPNG